MAVYDDETRPRDRRLSERMQSGDRATGTMTMVIALAIAALVGLWLYGSFTPATNTGMSRSSDGTTTTSPPNTGPNTTTNPTTTPKQP